VKSAGSLSDRVDSPIPLPMLDFHIKICRRFKFELCRFCAASCASSSIKFNGSAGVKFQVVA
jgi:hypothetical protein